MEGQGSDGGRESTAQVAIVQCSKGEGGVASYALPIIEEELQWESEDEEDDDDYWLAKPAYGLSNAGNSLLFAIILCSQFL